MAHYLQGLILLALAAAAQTQTQPCKDCHAGVAASTKPGDVKRPPRAKVAHFDHALHLKLGNPAPVILAAVKSKTYLSTPAPELAAQLTAAKDACTTCHRGQHPDAAHPTARMMPAMADCLVCHPKIDPPFTCEKCHDASPNLKPATHQGDFFDSHSSKRVEKTTCAVCHGRKFTCQGCH